MTWSASIRPIVERLGRSFCSSTSVRRDLTGSPRWVPFSLSWLLLLDSPRSSCSSSMTVCSETARHKLGSPGPAHNFSLDLTRVPLTTTCRNKWREPLRWASFSRTRISQALCPMAVPPAIVHFPSASRGSYSTLAIGHTCKDVTSQLWTVPTNESYSNQDGTTQQVFWANLTAPNRKNYSFSATGLQIGASPFTLSTRAYSDPNYGSIAIVQMVLTHSLGQKNATAYRCSIFSTINTYEVNIAKTVLQERLLETVPVGVNLISAVNTTAVDTSPETLSRRQHYHGYLE
jgi:hypothetical protein